MRTNSHISRSKRWIYGCITLLVFALLFPALKPVMHSPKLSHERMGALAVKQSGRIKPWDSFARETLLSFRGKQNLKVDGTKISAMEWLTLVFFNPSSANQIPLFRVDHEDLKTKVGSSDSKKKYFSYNDLFPHFAKVDTAARLSDPEPDRRDAFQKAVVELHSKLVRYQQLLRTFKPDFISESNNTDFLENLEIWLESTSNATVGSLRSLPWKPEALQIDLIAAKGLSPAFIYSYVSDSEPIWLSLTAAMHQFNTAEPMDPGLRSIHAYFSISSKWNEPNREKAARLNQSFSWLENSQQQQIPKQIWKKLNMEYTFNQIQPFILCIELYLLVFVLTLIAWVSISNTLLRSVFWVLFIGFLVHSAAMIVRMWIMGRPPVTNLYSSAVFVGWGTVALGLGLEWIYKNGIGSAMAAITGLLSLIVAQHLMEMGDTLGVMRAVLDSNFWLTTHVITVTLGYSATFVAGFIAIFYVIIGLLTDKIDQELQQIFHRMVYGIICFALLFSFIGTFLGGIWADQSWGRFWGWDPKENGALLIVVWNAVILHAKHARQIGTSGMMICAIIGNIVTAWSWFGTNMLGQGLHSYGFMESALIWLFLFWLSQIIFIGAGLLPKKHWKSKFSLK